jgi:hypothetical protein
MLTQAIRDRDEQIEQLQDKLSEASRYIITYQFLYSLMILRKSHSISKLLSTYFREIESSAALIESFTTASSKKGGKAGVDPIQKSLINVRGQLQKAEEKIQELEENVKDAEDAARSVKKHFFFIFTLHYSIAQYS